MSLGYCLLGIKDLFMAFSVQQKDYFIVGSRNRANHCHTQFQCHSGDYVLLVLSTLGSAGLEILFHKRYTLANRHNQHLIGLKALTASWHFGLLCLESRD